MTRLMFPCLVLFLRHYTLQRSVVLAEDVENAAAGIPGATEQEKANDSTNANAEDGVKVDEKQVPEGDDVTLTI